MEWINSLIDWAKANDALLWWLFALSIALFLLTPIAVSWAAVRMPADYFTAKRRQPLESWKKYPALRIVALIAKNLLGFVLAMAGLLMLVVPGQGLLTIVVGLILLDFPGKFHLQKWLITRGKVWRSINWLRKRAGREPLKKPKGD